jgi:group I intron endonuclease
MFEDKQPIVLISGQMNLFEEGWNGRGIYAFSGIAPSSFKHPIYVGSAVDLYDRIIYDHIPQINKSIHDNKPLEFYTKKNGWQNIVVWLFEEVQNKEDLVKEEQKYLDYYGTTQGGMAFNICPIAGSRLGSKASEETRLKISILKKGVKFSDASKKKLSEARMGIKLSPESIRKRTEKRAKEFKFLNPEGHLIEGKNLTKFCLENGLSQSSMQKLYSGKITTHKGWKKA